MRKKDSNRKFAVDTHNGHEIYDASAKKRITLMPKQSGNINSKNNGIPILNNSSKTSAKI